MTEMSAFGGKADIITGKAEIRRRALTRQNSDCDYDAVPVEAGDLDGAAKWRKIIKSIEVMQATEPDGAMY